MVGQAVGATGAAPAVLVGAGVPAGAKHNRPARRPVTSAPAGVLTQRGASPLQVYATACNRL